MHIKGGAHRRAPVVRWRVVAVFAVVAVLGAAFALMVAASDDPVPERRTGGSVLPGGLGDDPGLDDPGLDGGLGFGFDDPVPDVGTGLDQSFTGSTGGGSTRGGDGSVMPVPGAPAPPTTRPVSEPAVEEPAVPTEEVPVKMPTEEVPSP